MFQDLLQATENMSLLTDRCKVLMRLSENMCAFSRILLFLKHGTLFLVPPPWGTWNQFIEKRGSLFSIQVCSSSGMRGSLKNSVARLEINGKRVMVLQQIKQHRFALCLGVNLQSLKMLHKPVKANEGKGSAGTPWREQSAMSHSSRK